MKRARLILIVLSSAIAAGCGSVTARALRWRDADAGDLERFPARVIPNASPLSPLQVAGEARSAAIAQPVTYTDKGKAREEALDAFLSARGTTSFLVLRGDTLLYERYFNGASDTALATTFSVSKSIVSLAVGVALDQGFLHSIDDPVTRYLPELTQRDARFERITLRHLLTMSAGLRFKRGKTPWSDEARSYYSSNLRAEALAVQIETEPGKTFLYNPYNPIVLGLVLERATKMSLSKFLSVHVWQPMGMEGPASWSLDSEQHGFEKMESGFNARPRDLARIGLLYLNGGSWNGRRIVSARWVEESTRADTLTDPSMRYQYMWWVRRTDDRADRYNADGRFGQFIYVAPTPGIVIVRTGVADGDVSWVSLFDRIAERAVAPHEVAARPRAGRAP